MRAIAGALLLLVCSCNDAGPPASDLSVRDVADLLVGGEPRPAPDSAGPRERGPGGDGTVPGGGRLSYSDLDSAPVGAWVTVWGSGLGKSGTLTVGGIAAQSHTWTETQIIFKVPAAGKGISVNGGPALTFEGRSTGKIYFVSQKDGSDSFDGSQATAAGGSKGPWKTVARLKQSVAPGDVVYVRAGVYKDLDVLASVLHVNLSGEEGQPIAVTAYPGETAELQASMGNPTKRALRLDTGVHDWTVAKLRMSNASQEAIVAGPGKRIRLVANEIFNCPSPYGTVEVSAITTLRFLGNVVRNSGQAGNKLAHLFYYAGNGVGSDVEVAWNTLHDEGGGRCVQIYGHGDSDQLTNLRIHHNTCHNAPCDGILVGGSDGAAQDWVKDAKVYNNEVWATGSYASDYGNIRINNPGCVADVYDNVVHDSARASIAVTEAAAGTKVHDNCLDKAPSVSVPGKVTLANNATSYPGCAQGKGPGAP